ncbi:MAG: DNA-binding transcriptional regulator [Magnetospirillum sp.]|nr:DNA-binding transcriptional regulator [Magnetospirillum sp.]
MSKILNSVHEAARDLHQAGLVGDVTMRRFDDLCLPDVPAYTPEDIRRIRADAQVSQAVFARYLNVGTSTVQQWEQGVKRPRGSSLKLLQVVERKGLDILA